LFNFGDRDRRIGEIARGWLLGRRSRPLFGVRWNDYFALPLDEVRRRLGLDVKAVDAELPLRAGVHEVRAAA
jgi:ubiquinone biosynthesis protein COQ4